MSVCVEPAASASPTQAHHTSGRRLLADLGRVGGATVVCHGLGLITALLLRGLLGPIEMGVWQGLRMFLGYGNYLSLGVNKGAAREWSIALGRGDTAAAERGLDLAFTVNTLTSLAAAIMLAIAGTWLALAGSGTTHVAWGVGLVVLGLLIVLQRHVTFHVGNLRAAQQFGATARLSVVEAVLTVTLTGLATWLGGIYGLYAATVAVMLGAWMFVVAAGARRSRWAWNRAEVGRLVGIGAPILLTGIVTTLFRSVDKLAILAVSPDREYELGVYSLALLVSGQLYSVGNTLAIVVGPRLGALFGHSSCHRTVAEFAVRTSAWQAAVLAAIGGLAIVAGPRALSWLFPAYRAGLEPLSWVVLGGVALGMSLPGSQYLISVGLERRGMWAIIGPALLALVGDWLALRWGGGLMAVAMVTTLSYVLYALVVGLLAFGPTLTSLDRRRALVDHFFALVPALAAALFFEHGWSAQDPSRLLVLRNAMAVTAASCLSLLWLYRREQTRHAMPTTFWSSLAARCQKPDHEQIGNWFARKVSRPMALRVTWVLLPTGVSAHAITLAAWVIAFAAAGLLGYGERWSLVAGAGMLQLWYLLDHVDGQIARYRQAASLDGVQLDYLMHHTIDLLLPCAFGFGMFRATGAQGALVAGFVWGLAALVLGLEHDVRAKAFIQRLKRLEGRLDVIGGGGGRPAPAPALPAGLWRRIARLARKACEVHVVMNTLGVLALASLFSSNWPVLGWGYLLAMASGSATLAARQVATNLRREAAEREFAQWYRVPDEHVLVCEAGNWQVRPIDEVGMQQLRKSKASRATP